MRTLVMVAIFIVGAVIGYGVSVIHPPNSDFATREGGYAFINPLLTCNISEEHAYAGFGSLNTALNNVIEDSERSGNVKRVAVYFRDMDTGHWTGVRQDDLFAPASLMKVPLLMAYLKESQTDASLLESILLIPPRANGNATEHFPPQTPLESGPHTVQELLNTMIRESDNNAEAALNAAVATSSINNVYETLNLPPINNSGADVISPKGYMTTFRFLYNASYLGRTRSQSALKLLAETTFTEGIVAGVPAGTPVSHKFGEREVIVMGGVNGPTLGSKSELHDCGIVYYPHHPYGLCVMTEGSDMDTLATVIAAISKAAYDEVDSGLLNK